MSWVVVIPKEGRARGAAPALILVLQRLFKKKKKKYIQNLSKKFFSKKSMSYPKKGGRGPARPSFFWYDMTQDIRDLFAYHRPSWTTYWQFECTYLREPCVNNDLGKAHTQIQHKFHLKIKVWIKFKSGHSSTLVIENVNDPKPIELNIFTSPSITIQQTG